MNKEVIVNAVLCSAEVLRGQWHHVLHTHTKDDVSIPHVQRVMKFMLHQTHKSRYAEITCHVILRGTCMSHV